MRKLHYAWIIAGVAFVTLLVAGAIRLTPGLLIVPLENEFQWSRATISFAGAHTLRRRICCIAVHHDEASDTLRYKLRP